MEKILLPISAVAAWIALIISLLSYFRSKQVDKLQLYLSLRNRYMEIRRLIPDKYFSDLRYKDINTRDIVYIEQYWYHVFDEWFSTKILNNGKYADLWDLFFRNVTLSTLKYESMRYVVWQMLEGSVSFGDYKEEFSQIIEELWQSLGNEGGALSSSFDKK